MFGAFSPHAPSILKFAKLLPLFTFFMQPVVNTSATDIHDAIIKNQFSTVQTLIGQQPSFVNLRDFMGKSPLYWTAVTGNSEITELLLVHGADPNLADNQGFTPLHTAAGNGWVAVAEKLLAYGANVNSKSNSSGATPLHFVAGRNITPDMEDEVKALIGVKDVQVAVINNRMMITPSARNSLEMAKLLITNGASTDIPDKDGQTPLYWVTQFNGDIELVRLLLDKGATPTLKNTRGKTPLHEAAYCGNLETVMLLVSRKVDVNAQDSNGATPLIAAAACPSEGTAYDVVRYLLSAGADVNARQKNGWSVLGIARGWNHQRIAELLAQNGAKDFRGW